MPTIFDGHRTPAEALAVLEHRFATKTKTQALAQVAADIYAAADAEEAETGFDRGESARLLSTGDPERPVPVELLAPDTLLAAVVAEEDRADKLGDADRRHACAALRAYLRSGSITTVANALIEAVAENEAGY